MSAVSQGQNESPAAYLEKLMDAYHRCTPLLHVHGLVYREKTLQNLSEVQDLLATSLLPQRVAVVHVPGHQKGSSLEAEENLQAACHPEESEAPLEKPRDWMLRDH